MLDTVSQGTAQEGGASGSRGLQSASFSQHLLEAPTCEWLSSLILHLPCSFLITLLESLEGEEIKLWVQPAIFDHLSPNSTFYLKFQICSISCP